MKVSPAQHKALKRIFPEDKFAVQQIISLLDVNQEQYHPLRLPGCHNVTSCVLSYAQHHVVPLTGIETWDPNFNAFCFKSEHACDTQPNGVSVLFVRALLVGVLDGDSEGAMRISSPDCPKGMQVVIAPPPDVTMKKTPVWFRDWRYVPSHILGGSVKTKGVFEVLLKDVVVLKEHGYITAPIESVSKDTVLNPYKIINVRGVMRAKSSIIASSRPVPCFFAEIVGTPATESEMAALTIVFQGKEAVKWWPFLKLGCEFCFYGLLMFVLPNYDRKTVLKASGNSTKITIPEDGTQTRPKKHSRVDYHADTPSGNLLSNTPSPNKAKMGQSLITYEGEITRALKDGRFELDRKVVLHLGGFNGFCAGPAVSSLCFRKGARIQACWVHVCVGGSGSVRLLPTGRTVVNVLYFGSLSLQKRTNSTVAWSMTPWRWLWKRWEYGDILWAEELFDALVAKFGPWLCDLSPSASTQNEEISMSIVESLLGSQSAIGLVQFIMYIQTRRENVLRTNISAKRNLFREFFNPYAITSGSIGVQCPLMPTLKCIEEAAGRFWKSRRSKLISKYESLKMPEAVDVFQIIISAEEVSQIIEGRNIHIQSGVGRKLCTAVVGLLNGSPCNPGQLQLSDATGTLLVRSLGSIQPFLLGAMVYISEFSLIVESRQGCNTRIATLVFDPGVVRVVMDGPYVQVDTGSKGILEKEASEHIGKGILGSLSQVATARESIQDKGRHLMELSARRTSSLLVDIPLVSIHVVRIQKRKGKYTAFGRLIAVMKTKNENEWYVVDNNRKGFWRCSLTLSGESALQIAPALQEEALIAVSCTDLCNAANPVEHVRKMAKQQASKGNILELTTNLETKAPWVENLGSGCRMRLKHHYEGHVSKNVERRDSDYTKAELHAYVRRGIEHFRKQAGKGIISSLWKAFETTGEVKDEEKVVSIEGVVHSISSFPCTFDSNDENTVMTVKLRDGCISCVVITISFYTSSAVPAGIAPGMKIILRDVARISMRKTGRFAFIGNSGTACQLKGWDRAVTTKQTCQSCATSWQCLKTVSEKIQHMYLWEFSERHEIDCGKSYGAGIMEFRIVRVERVKLYITSSEVDCERCGVRDEYKERWTVQMCMAAVIEDGSCEGQVVCEGFEKCTQLLKLSDKQKKMLKEVAMKEREVFLESREGMNFGRSNVEVIGSSNERRRKVTEIVQGSVEGTSIGVIVNRTWRRFSGEYEVEEVEMKGFGLGFGRKLWTACAGYAEVVGEIVGLVTECDCKDKPCEMCWGRDVSATSIGRLLLDEEG